MAKAGRGQTRRDSKRRVLRPGESVRADGKYQYKYHIDGKPHFVYSWKLEPTDKLPKGKKPCLSLRELEKQVNTDLDLLVNIVDGQMTVCELVDRYLKTKTGVRQSTKQGYVTVQRLLAKESFQAIIADTLGDACDYETVKTIHENLNELISEHKDDPEPVVLDKYQVKTLLENSGVEEEQLENFDQNFDETAGERASIYASNIASTRAFEVKTPDVVVKVNPERTDLVETREIDGRQCLVITIDGGIEVNGILVNQNGGITTEKNTEN